MRGASLRYIPALDGLRAIAVGLVLVTHAADPYVVPGGYGVDVFFVLSGFLITTILWKESQRSGRIALGAFYLRRLIRLYPALLTMLVVSFVVGSLVTGNVARLGVDVLAGVFYATPFTDALIGHGTFTQHLWTLALEEYFYLVWPLALIVALRIGLSWKSIVAILLAGTAALYGLRFASALIRGIETHPPRIAGIALGCAVALIIANTAIRGNPRVLWACGLGGLALAWFTALGGVLVDAATPLIAACATVCIVFAVLDEGSTWAQRVLETAPFVYVGKISYELYLWHIPVVVYASVLSGQDRYRLWWWAYPLALLLAGLTHAAYTPLQRRLREAVAGHRIAPVISVSRAR